MLKEHWEYVSDSLRLEQFGVAVAQVVRPGARVVDVGCGSAVLGLMCLQAGAAHVYAIDSTDAIEVARELLARSGWAGQADFIHGSSYQVELPQKADVVICDHVGYFGFDYGLIEMLADARCRFLKPGGILIPGRLKLHLAAVESEKCRALADGWKAPGVPSEFHWLRQYGVNTKYAVNLQPDEVLSGHMELACIDLHADNPDFFSWTTELTVARDGALHGLAGWFECELADGIWMTNSPVSDRAIKRPQAFLPIAETLTVKTGDVVSVTVMARPSDNLLAWELRHLASGKKFSHSTWLGSLLADGQLHGSHPEHVPQLTRTAQARNVVLAYCDGERSVSQIQEAVRREHPDLFPSGKEIVRFVGSVLGSNTK